NRPLRHEKVVRLLDFSDTPVPGWFEERGWTPMLIASGDVCIELVQEFYANLIPTPNEALTFSTYVRGHALHFDSIDFSEFLHVADNEVQDILPHPRL
ncbi:hypothetical protein U1Q18_045706, partial [Sarracenia purpurea var. burkii]